jgi:hypothetical protein
MLYLDGVCVKDNYGQTRFDDEHPCSPLYGQPMVVLIHSRWIGHPIKMKTKSELNSLTHRIRQRAANFSWARGLISKNDDNDYQAFDGPEDEPMLQIHGYSITYRIATCRQQGRKVFIFVAFHQLVVLPSPSPNRSACLSEDFAAQYSAYGFPVHA